MLVFTLGKPFHPSFLTSSPRGHVRAAQSQTETDGEQFPRFSVAGLVLSKRHAEPTCRATLPNRCAEPTRPKRRDRKNKRPGQSEITTTADIKILRRKLTPLKPVTPSTANGGEYKVPTSARKAVQKTGWRLLSRGLYGANVGFSRTVRSADFRGSLGCQFGNWLHERRITFARRAE